MCFVYRWTVAENAESAPRCTNHRTGKRQLSTETAGNNFGKRTHRQDRFYTNAILVQRSAQAHSLVLQKNEYVYTIFFIGKSKRQNRVFKPKKHLIFPNSSFANSDKGLS